jgi:hypothetical protein
MGLEIKYQTIPSKPEKIMLERKINRYFVSTMGLEIKYQTIPSKPEKIMLERKINRYFASHKYWLPYYGIGNKIPNDSLQTRENYVGEKDKPLLCFYYGIGNKIQNEFSLQTRENYVGEKCWG